MLSTKMYLYADDAIIYEVIKQMSDLQAIMNLRNWSDEWLV